MISQNVTGRAFEYGVAISLSRLIPANLTEDKHIEVAKSNFELCSETERENIVKAANEISMFLVAHDNRLTETNCTIKLQSDQHGQEGDVRDIIIYNKLLNKEIGISAKNRNFAVKHSRLSEHIDFGREWIGIDCSNVYFYAVTPIFRELNSRKDRGELWRDIKDKQQRFYMPILQSFMVEMELIFKNNPTKAAKALLKYLLGKYDYYKIIKENGEVSITSYNIDRTLKWGSKFPLPTSLVSISLKPNSNTTAFMTFDKGWSISFRIHNASEKVEPSLKFDINLVGQPSTMARHVINYG